MNRNSWFRPVGASPTVMGLSSVNIGFSRPPRAGPVPDGPDSSPAHIEGEGSGGRADRPAAFQEVLHGLCLLGVQRRGPAASPALGRGAVHAGLGTAPDGVPLPLGQGQEHVRHWLGGWNETRLS